MNKGNIHGLYCVVTAVVAISVTFLIMYPFTQRKKADDIFSAKNRLRILPDSTNYMMRNFVRGLNMEGVTLNDVPLYKEGERTSLHKLVKEPTLVFRFFEMNCEPCIREEISVLQKRMGTLSSKVLLVGSYATYKGMRAFLTANQLNLFPAYHMSPVDTLEWEPERYESPYYFILYPGGKTSHFFMSVPEYINFTQRYLEGMKRLLE